MYLVPVDIHDQLMGCDACLYLYCRTKHFLGRLNTAYCSQIPPKNPVGGTTLLKKSASDFESGLNKKDP